MKEKEDWKKEWSKLNRCIRYFEAQIKTLKIGFKENGLEQKVFSIKGSKAYWARNRKQIRYILRKVLPGSSSTLNLEWMRRLIHFSFIDV